MIADLPNDLAIGRRAVLQMPGFELLDDLRWDDHLKLWVMRIRLTCGNNPSADGLIQPVTNWYVVVGPHYPLGELRVYPDREGGINSTFQHQSFNAESSKLPWLMGEICVSTSLSKFWRKGYTHEPINASGRLKWNIGRVMEWIKAAINDELTAPGEPFELPPKPKSTSLRLVFNEDEETFQTWKAVSVISGKFRVKCMTINKAAVLVDEFRLRQEGMTYSWGSLVQSEKERDWEGIWVMLKRLPVMDRWRVPTTWDQLFAIGGDQGVDIQAELIYQYSKSKYGVVKYVALGFPIPGKYGEPSSRVHWFAAVVGAPSKRDGFRGEDEAFMRNAARILFAAGKKIDWMPSENWNKEQISARGKVSVTLQDSSIVLIGAGAVGSLLSEMLLRLGCGKMTIVDDQCVEIGNLSRHQLTMESIGKYKAEQLANRLNSIFPYASISFRNCSVQEIIEKDDIALEGASIVVDATGDDEVIKVLSDRLSVSDKALVSISNGLKADRLFCFVSKEQNDVSFVDRFFEKLRPWLDKERQENDKLELVWEGAGCWHPIFPARLDDVAMLLGAVIKPLEDLLEQQQASNLIVVEKEYSEEATFKGLKIIRNG